MQRALFLVLGIAAASALVHAQEQADPRTLIPSQTLNAIAQRVSGAQAHNHVLEMCPYERNRPAEEYTSGTYRESAYAEAKAKEYGFSDVHIERFPLGSKQWDGEMAELWVTEPGPAQLISRYRDMPTTLATGSRSGDVTAELVYAGRGDTADDYKGRDVKGKIVLVSGPVGAAHNLAVRQFGAEGVVSYFNAPASRSIVPIRWDGAASTRGPIPTPGRRGASSCRCAWGSICSSRLERHQKVKVHAIVKAAEYDAPMNVVVATIPGDGSTNEEFHFTAHLFEGIAKQGANDNCGGPATQLEAGRAWIEMIKDGTLPKPKRTVRFLWVPEITGTRAYLQKHPELGQHVVASISTDMVGANQTHQPQLAAPEPDDVFDPERDQRRLAAVLRVRRRDEPREAAQPAQRLRVPESDARSVGHARSVLVQHREVLRRQRSPGASRLGSADSGGAVRQLAGRGLSLERRFAGEPGSDADEARGVPDDRGRQRLRQCRARRRRGRGWRRGVVRAEADGRRPRRRADADRVEHRRDDSRTTTRKRRTWSARPTCASGTGSAAARSLAMGDKTAIADIEAYGEPLHEVQHQQHAMVLLAYTAAAARLKVTAVDPPVPTAAETAASKLIPKRKPGTPAQPQGGPGGGGQGPRQAQGQRRHRRR